MLGGGRIQEPGNISQMRASFMKHINKSKMGELSVPQASPAPRWIMWTPHGKGQLISSS